MSLKAPEALLMAGNSYFKIKEYDKAQKEYFYLILKFPDARGIDEAQYKIGQCFQALENNSAAANAYKQVQIFYPKSNLAQESLFLSAKMNFEARDYERTIETLYEFLELFPTSSSLQEAQLLLINAFIKNDNYDRARLEIDKILGTTQTGKYHAE
ncbi:MAG: tetratricopeptide repeat protein, partial [bacterium]|nr:tetratricopeptide repeat protein [bacterium]